MKSVEEWNAIKLWLLLVIFLLVYSIYGIKDIHFSKDEIKQVKEVKYSSDDQDGSSSMRF